MGNPRFLLASNLLVSNLPYWWVTCEPTRYWRVSYWRVT